MRQGQKEKFKKYVDSSKPKGSIDLFRMAMSGVASRMPLDREQAIRDKKLLMKE
jgi:hypothetical protein